MEEVINYINLLSWSYLFAAQKSMKMENQQKPKIRNGITKDFFLRDVVNMTSKSWQEYCID